MIIPGIVLAAGTSSRMGSVNKLLLKYKDHTVVEEVLEQLSDSKIDDILVVTGFERTRIERLFADRPMGSVSFICNENYRLGRAESIKCAIRQIESRADAALFTLADKPGITSTLINKAIDCYLRDRPAILYVEIPSGRGHPIIFSKDLFGDLLQLKGDCVGDELVAKYKDDLVTVKDDARQIDIDCMADYRILLKNETAKKA
jgi:molybdenum cofactor cytidylyltransferase